MLLRTAWLHDVAHMITVNDITSDSYGFPKRARIISRTECSIIPAIYIFTYYTGITGGTFFPMNHMITCCNQMTNFRPSILYKSQVFVCVMGMKIPPCWMLQWEAFGHRSDHKPPFAASELKQTCCCFVALRFCSL